MDDWKRALFSKLLTYIIRCSRKRYRRGTVQKETRTLFHLLRRSSSRNSFDTFKAPKLKRSEMNLIHDALSELLAHPHASGRTLFRPALELANTFLIFDLHNLLPWRYRSKIYFCSQTLFSCPHTLCQRPHQNQCSSRPAVWRISGFTTKETTRNRYLLAYNSVCKPPPIPY